jgi:hypothetical protein
MKMSALAKNVIMIMGNEMRGSTLRMMLLDQFKDLEAPHNAGDSGALIT